MYNLDVYKINDKKKSIRNVYWSVLAQIFKLHGLIAIYEYD